MPTDESNYALLRLVSALVFATVWQVVAVVLVVRRCDVGTTMMLVVAPFLTVAVAELVERRARGPFNHCGTNVAVDSDAAPYVAVLGPPL